MVQAVHVFYLLGAWLFWGTYPVPFKSAQAKKSNCDPFAFQFMKSICVFLTSWIILAWKPFTFTLWGLVGAALWIPSGLLYITSLQLTGVAFAAPIANGCQVIVSFCWGAFYFKEEVHSWLLSAVALFIMILGMICISFAVNYEQWKARKEAQKTSHYTINVSVSAQKEPNEGSQLLKGVTPSEYTDYLKENAPPKPTPAEEKMKFILGIVCALSSGFFGATQNVPLKHAPPEAHGIQYVISFGIGAVAVITIFTIVYCIIRMFMNKGLPTVNPRLSLGPGMLAGLLWSAGNMCDIYTVYAWGTTVGFPLVMCNMMIAGMWGVFFYNEAPSWKMKLAFIASCAVLLGGVTILSLYG